MCTWRFLGVGIGVVNTSRLQRKPGPLSPTSGAMEVFGLPWPDLNEGLAYADTVQSTIAGSTLVDFYSKNHKKSAPFQGWLQRIRNGQITIDGRVVTDPDTVLRAGSELVYHRFPWKEPDAPFVLGILYEDDDLIALNKPSGLQVLPGGLFQQRTVLTQLQWRVQKQDSSQSGSSGKPEVSHPAPVHRLGRGTSGILLCAKTKLAKARLAAYFADGTSLVANQRCAGNTNMGHCVERKILKVYRALVSGIVEKDEVIVEQPIGMIQYPGVAKGLYVASLSGKPALSKVYVLKRDFQRNNTLVQVEIQSGRPHQIRIHLSFIGHPLLGDPLYVAGGHPSCFDSKSGDDSYADDGGYRRPTNPVPGDCGYYLHAHRLVLHHPTRNEVLKITAPLPSILQTREEASGGIGEAGDGSK